MKRKKFNWHQEIAEDIVIASLLLLWYFGGLPAMIIGGTIILIGLNYESLIS